MFRIFCVTNRALCKGDLLRRVENIAETMRDRAGDGLSCGIIVREKDLSESEYESLAQQVIAVCKTRNIACILHNFPSVAEKLGSDGLHLPLEKFLQLSDGQKSKFKYLGASCHSLDDVVAAQKAGANYVTLGHIFATDCKRGLPPRGVDFLHSVCEKSSVPVLAIGGITQENIGAVAAAKASGACVMSGFMQCDDVGEYFDTLIRAAEI